MWAWPHPWGQLICIICANFSSSSDLNETWYTGTTFGAEKDGANFKVIRIELNFLTKHFYRRSTRFGTWRSFWDQLLVSPHVTPPRRPFWICDILSSLSDLSETWYMGTTFGAEKDGGNFKAIWGQIGSHIEFFDETWNQTWLMMWGYMLAVCPPAVV